MSAEGIMPALRWWRAPAKLNLCLHVVGRRADGYHELQTVFQLIDLCDLLAFEVAPTGGITLNFRDADIDVVIAAFGHLLDRPFIIDPRVKGKMTLEMPRPVSKAQAFQLL